MHNDVEEQPVSDVVEPDEEQIRALIINRTETNRIDKIRYMVNEVVKRFLLKLITKFKSIFSHITKNENDFYVFKTTDKKRIKIVDGVGVFNGNYDERREQVRVFNQISENNEFMSVVSYESLPSDQILILLSDGYLFSLEEIFYLNIHGVKRGYNGNNYDENDKDIIEFIGGRKIFLDLTWNVILELITIFYDQHDNFIDNHEWKIALLPQFDIIILFCYKKKLSYDNLIEDIRNIFFKKKGVFGEQYVSSLFDNFLNKLTPYFFEKNFTWFIDDLRNDIKLEIDNSELDDTNKLIEPYKNRFDRIKNLIFQRIIDFLYYQSVTEENVLLNKVLRYQFVTVLSVVLSKSVFFKNQPDLKDQIFDMIREQNSSMEDSVFEEMEKEFDTLCGGRRRRNNKTHQLKRGGRVRGRVRGRTMRCRRKHMKRVSKRDPDQRNRIIIRSHRRRRGIPGKRVRR